MSGVLYGDIEKQDHYEKKRIVSVAERELMKMKKVSAIVPCYNVARYLDKCVDSLLSQTIGIEAIEIILVDDASTDEGATRALIESYEQHFPETIIAIFQEQNTRQGGARNTGLVYATGEYITFCDADDWILEGALAHCYDIAKKYDVDIIEFAKKNVYTRDGTIGLDKGDRNVLLELDTVERKKEFLLNALRGPGDIGSQYTLFKRSLIQENRIAFIEHRFMEEISFTVPARLYAKRYYYLDERSYMYFQSPGSTVRTWDWEDRKWDNMQAWVLLIEDLEQRGLFPLYRQEIGYLFFLTGFGHSLQLIFQKGRRLTKEEWKLITDITKELIPDIRQNVYVQKERDPFNRAWNDLLLQLLDIEYTDESAGEACQSMISCIKALWECPAFH